MAIARGRTKRSEVVHHRLPCADRAGKGPAACSPTRTACFARRPGIGRSRLIAAGYLRPSTSNISTSIRRRLGVRAWKASSSTAARWIARRRSRSSRASTCSRCPPRMRSRRASSCSRRWPAASRSCSRATAPFPEIFEQDRRRILVEAGRSRRAGGRDSRALARSRNGRGDWARRAPRGVQQSTTRVGRMAEAAERVYTELAGRDTVTPSTALDASVDVSKSYSTPRGELPILHDVSLSLDRGRVRRRSWARPAAARARCSTSSARSNRRRRARSRSTGRIRITLGERAQAAFRNRHIGFVFQDHSLLPQCSVLENVLAPTLVAPPTGTRRRRHRARARAAGAGGAWRSTRSSAWRAVRRREAAGRHRARADPRSAAAAVRRADGQPRRASAERSRRCCSTCTEPRDVLIVVTHSAALAEPVSRRNSRCRAATLHRRR